VKEVLNEELGRFQDAFKKQLRGLEVCVSGGGNAGLLRRNAAPWAIEVLQRQVLHIEHQRRRRSLEVGELRKALRDVRKVLVDEHTCTPKSCDTVSSDANAATAGEHVAAAQLLMEIRDERERWRAEKRFLEQQICQIEESLQARLSTPTVDPEKEKLRRTVKQLQMSIESRDRFACWVCNQRAAREEQQQESSDEEEVDQKEQKLNREESSELIAMRRTIAAMRNELQNLRDAKVLPERAVQINDSIAEEPVTPVVGTRTCRNRVATPFHGDELQEQNVQAVDVSGSVTEEPVTPVAGTKSCRGRIATPFVVFSDLEATSDVHDQADPRRPRFSEEPVVVSEVPLAPNAPTMRPCRERIATPFLVPEAPAPRPTFAEEPAAVAEVELPRDAPTMRPSRDRIATPYVTTEAVESAAKAEKDAAAKILDFVDPASIVAVPAIGTRSPRDRVATPFVSFEAADIAQGPLEDGRRVQLVDRPVKVTEVELPSVAQMRPSRSRLATPFASPEATEEPKSVQFASAVEEEPIPEVGHARPSRGRIATPFYGDDMAASPPQRSEPRVRVAAASTSVEEVPLAADTPMRASRDRIATPFVSVEVGEASEKQAVAEEGRFITFRGDTEYLEPAIMSSSTRMRPCRERTATPFIADEMENEAGDEAASGRNVTFRKKVSLYQIEADGSAVRFEETPDIGEAASAASSGQPRSIRTRQLTGFVGPDADAVASVTTEPSSVRFTGHDEQLEAASAASSGQPRSIRTRQLTGFVGPDADAVASVTTEPSFVRFSGHDEDLEAASSANSGQPRSIRTRQLTGYVGPDAAAVASTPSESSVVCFAGREEELQAADTASSGQRRSIHTRQLIGYVGSDADAVVSAVAEPSVVRFAGRNEVLEAASAASSGQPRSIRTRQLTGYLGPEVAEVSATVEPGGVRFVGQAEELEAASAASSGQPRSIRTRQLTGYVGSEDDAAASAATAEPSAVRFAGQAEELEAASAASSGQPRSIRTRQLTGYLGPEADAAASAATAEPSAVRFVGQAEELQAASEANSLPPRSIRTRQLTGYVGPDIDESALAQPSSVRFAGQVEELEAASRVIVPELKRARERQETGFAYDEDAGSANAESRVTFDSEPNTSCVSFANQDSFVEAASSAAPPGQSRSVRDRTPTGFIGSDIALSGSASIKFSDTVTTGDAASRIILPELRSVRDRTPTGYVDEQPLEVRRGVQFADASKVQGCFDCTGSSVQFAPQHSIAEAASIITADAQPVVTRTPTGCGNDGTLLDADSGVRFAEASNVVEVASFATVSKLRPVRGRKCTAGVVSCDGGEVDDSAQDSVVSFAASVATLPAASVLNPETVRSVRERTPTGYVDLDDSMHCSADAMGDAQPVKTRSSVNEVSSVRFAAGESVVDAASSAPPGEARSLRSRTPTQWVSTDQLPSADLKVSFAVEGAEGDPGCVRFASVDSLGEAASVAPEGARSAKSRIPTGACRLEDLPRESSGVSFAAGDCVVDVESTTLPGEARPVKSRAPTGSVRYQYSHGDALADSTDDKCVRFGGVAEVEDASTAGDDRLSSARTQWTDTSSNKSAADSEGSGSARQPRLEEIRSSDALDEGGFSDAETVSSCSSRNPRSRMSTPFMSAISLGFESIETPTADSTTGQKRRRSKSHATTPVDASATDRDQIKQVSMVSSIEREISERVRRSMFRQNREERLHRVMSGGIFERPLPVMGAVERMASIDGGELELDSRLMLEFQKDISLLKDTLRKLVFFEEFEDAALEELADAMEVYVFKDGEKVVRQGDTDGTHFYVVAEGEFAVVEDGRRISTLVPGESFGESVLLLFGERSSTVSAVGKSVAYAMEGTVVRDMLRQQFERRRQEVVCALDDVLAKGRYDMLLRLNAYQLQSLYDKVEMRSFAPGDFILDEGSNDVNEIFLLYTGSVVLRQDGADVFRLEGFGMLGDQAIVFQMQAADVVAEDNVKVLVLSQDLLESVYGEEMNQVLIRERILGICALHKVFSKLQLEQVDAVASTHHLRTLQPNEEFEAEDVRFVACLHGEFEVRTLDGSASVERLQSLDPERSTFGDVRRQDSPQKTRIRACTPSGSSVVAVWRSEDLDSILDDEDLNFALDQNYKLRVLRSVVLFKTLSMQQLQRLAGRLQIQHNSNGDRIVEQGSIGTHFYIIRKGLVQVRIGSDIVRKQGPGDYFGERALLFNEPRTASIDAVDDTELWVMGNDTFKETVQGPCLDYLQNRIHLQDTRVDLSDLQFMRVIGRGGYGVVKMVRHARTGMRYALKCVRKRPIVERHQQDTIINERSILLEVDHPFIIKCVRSFSGPKRVYFLMELVSGGELLDVLYQLGLLNRSQAQFYTGSIILALEFLHARRIAYLDLKCENCLIDHQGYLKLIDFGIALRIKGKGFGRRGTPMFMAPEMIRNSGYTTVADLWSLGICLYEFVLGEFPFANSCKITSQSQIFKEVLDSPLTFPENFARDPESRETMSLIQGLLIKDPAQRLGAQVEGYTAIKEHAFFHGLEWDMLMGRELKPPYISGSEVYAEDKEDIKNSLASVAISVEDEEAADCQDDDWVDPTPGWDSCF